MSERTIIEVTELELEQIAKEISEIGPVLFGTIKKNRNKRVRKDGSTYLSPVHYTFVYKSNEGKEQWKRINAEHLPIIERMKESGKEYYRLSKNYIATATRLALLQVGEKKTTDRTTTASRDAKCQESSG